MRHLFVLCLLACAASAQAVAGVKLGGVEALNVAAETQLSATNVRALFSDWLAKFKRAYREGDEEFERRFAVFHANALFVREFNAAGHSHKVALNAFADLTVEEFAVHRLGYRHDPAVRAARPQLPFRYEGVAAADAVDWRAAGAVTGVKDQGQCGSCWAFSTTGSLEGANFVVNGQLVSLSEQELIECDRSGNDRGCNGGLMDYAYEWIISNGGIDTEKDYPYTGTDEVCDTTKEHTVAVAVASFEDIPPNNEAAIKKAVTVQPVSIAIAASGLPFQLYSHGVFNGSCSTQLDHGVLIVGYDTDKETGADYWIVKNSWGEVWGDAGFIKMAMHHAPSGLCGLAMVPSYPVVKKAGPPGPGPGPAPPPGPGPTPPATITCDSKSGSTCPSTATCCCSLKIPYINYCVQWGCCPYVAATCCSDGSSCCPADHPVCDLDNGVCAASSALGASSALDTMPLGHKFAATRDFSRSSLLHFVSAAAAEDKE